MRMVAALFVQRGGAYYGLPDVDPWDEKRDARRYGGPHPVVAHPPCSRWCRLAGLVEARWGHKRGEDDGCFQSALASVRRWGGVLEHPAWSDAWPAFGLPAPAPWGWQRDVFGGWSCHVEQGRYGHPAKKATWLYAYGAKWLPSLKWGLLSDIESSALVSWRGNHTKKRWARIGDFQSNGDTDWDSRRRLGPREAAHTPPEFRDLLLSIARSVA